MSDVVVTTKMGEVAGSARDGVAIFRGIPYGAPPVGELRFKPPQPPMAWSGVREAKENELACPQPMIELQAGIGEMIRGAAEPEPQGEDCLVLNVFTPAPGAGKRPVMVWLHGGGWTLGSGGSPNYNGSKLESHSSLCSQSLCALLDGPRNSRQPIADMPGWPSARGRTPALFVGEDQPIRLGLLC